MHRFDFHVSAPQCLGLLAGLLLTTTTGCSSMRANTSEEQRRSALEATEARLEETRSALREAESSNRQLRSEAEVMEEQLEQVERLAETRNALLDRLETKLDGPVKEGTVKITERRGYLVVQFPADVLFDSNRLDLSKRGRKTLGQVAVALDGQLQQRRLLVIGHTDSELADRKNEQLDDNWDLSTRRALVALEVLLGNGLPGEKLGAAGFGQYDPLASNETDKGRRLNRRVELMILPDLSDLMDAAVPATTARAEHGK